MYDHGTRARAPKPGERLYAILIAADQALNLDAGDIGARRHKSAPRNEHQCCANDRKHGDHQRTDTPKRKLAPHTAAIDDDIGIERHGFAPSIESWVNCTHQRPAPGATHSMAKAASRLLLSLFRFRFGLVASPLLERSAQDIPERGT